MADVGTIDAFSIYSHYLQGIYKVVYKGSKWFSNGGESPEDCAPLSELQTEELANVDAKSTDIAILSASSPAAYLCTHSTRQIACAQARSQRLAASTKPASVSGRGT
jgi:hypothetical protein